MKKTAKLTCKNLVLKQKTENTWDILLKKEEGIIGSIVCDEKPNEKYEVFVSISIEERYRKKQYGTEALREMISWVFANTEAYYMMAEIQAGNLPAHGLLTNLGFVSCGETGHDTVRYELERPVVKYMVLYYLFGMSCGSCLGIANDNIALGMLLGLVFGALIGIALDKNDKKKRDEIKALRKEKEVEKNEVEKNEKE